MSRLYSFFATSSSSIPECHLSYLFPLPLQAIFITKEPQPQQKLYVPFIQERHCQIKLSVIHQRKVITTKSKTVLLTVGTAMESCPFISTLTNMINEGITAMGLSLLSPELYRHAFLVKQKTSEMIRYGVGGSTW
jgi:hypothetical protein